MPEEKPKPNANAAQIGMWNKTITPESKQFKSINRSPVELTEDQLIQLYMLLYPFIASEFSHRQDIKKWADDFMKKYNDDQSKQSSDILGHTHSNGNNGSPTGAPLQSISTPDLSIYPEDSDYKKGEALIAKTSKFSKLLLHRHPAQDSGVDGKLKVPDEYKRQDILIPFDLSDDEGFINQDTQGAAI